MKNKELALQVNLSSQGNVNLSKKLDLIQINAVVFIGLNKLLDIIEETETIPIRLRISRLGEFELDDKVFGEVDPNKIKIFSEKKVTNA